MEFLSSDRYIDDAGNGSSGGGGGGGGGIGDDTKSCLNLRNKTTIITNLYGGIPETLILNVIGWLIFILLFSVLRQQAWDYGRLALVNSTGDKKRWTQLFYAYGTDLNEGSTSANIGSGGGDAVGSNGGSIRSSASMSSGNGGIANGNRNSDGSTTAASPTSVSGGIGDGNGIGGTGGVGGRINGGGTNSINTPQTDTRSQTGTQRSNSTTYHIADRGFFSWITATLRLKKEQFLMHSGPDAVHYLSFQQHLMCVMAVITCVSLVVILPANLQGEQYGDVNSLGHTTISNLAPSSGLLWIHVVVAILYIPMVVLIMRRASGRNAFKTAASRTIMATNISQSDCNKQIIRNYVRELFPDIGIEDIQLAYNVSKLAEVMTEYEKIVEARVYCEVHNNRSTYPIMASPKCLTCKTVDALEYYREREMQLSGDVARLRASALNEPLGIAFITVDSPLSARNVIMHFTPGTYREWTLAFAPAPSDLFWEHLNVGSSQWYLKWFCVNFCLFLVLFFLTTPIYIVNLLDTFSLTRNTIRITPLISEFLPTLLLMTFATLMPVIVAYSDKWLSHWTRSKQNYSIMTKSFGYLLLMILILPSFGFTSAQALIQWTLIDISNQTFRWDCIFLPDKGAFFVNYIITTSLIGTSLELMRFADLICYIWELFTAKSRAETPYIRKSIVVEFPFGIHYAWTVMIFTVSTVYSVICPLIMPFAMVYIVLKHFGDRHNLYFAFGPSNMISRNGGKIHSTAVTMTKFAVIWLLVILAALAWVRNQNFDARGLVLIIALIATLVLFAFMSPIKKCTTKRPSIQESEGPTPVYIPKVLLNRRLNAAEISTHLGYGSDSPPIDVVVINNDDDDDDTSLSSRHQHHQHSHDENAPIRTRIVT